MSFDRKSYSFTDPELVQIGAWVLLPHDMRMEMMEKFFINKPPRAIMDMLSNFIDLAHTTVENCEEAAKLIGLTEFGANPYEVEKMNLPTLSGAINGVKITQGLNPAGVCHGCAFRRGSVANTCLVTTMDTTYCSENSQTFMCHENLDDKDQPTQKCRGFLKKEKKSNV